MSTFKQVTLIYNFIQFFIHFRSWESVYGNGPRKVNGRSPNIAKLIYFTNFQHKVLNVRFFTGLVFMRNLILDGFQKIELPGLNLTHKLFKIKPSSHIKPHISLEELYGKRLKKFALSAVHFSMLKYYY